ncbi:MAG: sugar phosphate isomerase/epimerase family protein [Bryobacteraceae bacterium]
MQPLRDLEIGVVFWGGRDPAETVREHKALGVRCGQLLVPGGMDAGPASQQAWKRALEAEGFTVVTVFAAYDGEDYADIPAVQRTVGFIPRETRAAREKRTYEVIDFGAALGVKSFGCHIGYVPEDTCNSEYLAVRDMVRRVCDYAARHGQTFALETGQEPAPVLLRFFKDVGKPNLRINFDPANMILYGSGDPIDALTLLAPHVESVHAKDGDWPPKGSPDALGVEKPLGQGSVGMERFVAKLKEVGFKAPLNIERETPDHAERLRDIKMGVGLLERLRG